MYILYDTMCTSMTNLNPNNISLMGSCVVVLTAHKQSMKVCMNMRMPMHGTL